MQALLNYTPSPVQSAANEMNSRSADFVSVSSARIAECSSCYTDIAFLAEFTFPRDNLYANEPITLISRVEIRCIMIERCRPTRSCRLCTVYAFTNRHSD